MAYYYAYAYHCGRVTISKKYNSFEEAYQEYFQAMNEHVNAGRDVSRMRWRGVWDAAGLLDALAEHLDL